MGKRYKKGNRGRTRYRPRKAYRIRENELNKDINMFRKYLFDKEVNDTSNYCEADKLRRRIKNNLRIQSKYINKYGPRSRFRYYDQLHNFKGLYVTWKKISLPTFLRVRYKFPEHLIPALCNYYEHVKTGGLLSYNLREY